MTDEPKKTEAPAPQPKAEKPRKAVNVGGLIVLGVIVLLLAWYLIGGRYTPVTSQARVQGYVVGVAPKVGGLVTEVFVTNNQEVREGDKLFQIDTSQFQISLDTARSDLEAATRQLEAGDAAVEAAKANLNAAMANQTKAEKDASRLQRLKDQDPGTISQRRLEVSLATLDQAKAAVAAAEAGIQQAIESMGGRTRQRMPTSKGPCRQWKKPNWILGIRRFGPRVLGWSAICGPMSGSTRGRGAPC